MRVVAARMVAARMVPTMELARVEQLRLSGRAFESGARAPLRVKALSQSVGISSVVAHLFESK